MSQLTTNWSMKIVKKIDLKYGVRVHECVSYTTRSCGELELQTERPNFTL